MPSEDDAAAGLTLPYAGTLNLDKTPAFQVTSSGDSAVAIKGIVLSGTNVTNGIYGYTNSAKGQSVYGYAGALSGNAYGVAGKTNSPNGAGITGEGPYNGVRGVATQLEGTPPWCIRGSPRTNRNRCFGVEHVFKRSGIRCQRFEQYAYRLWCSGGITG